MNESHESDDPCLPPPDDSRLPAVLGLFSASTIVVGGVIGSGIFIFPKKVAQNVGGDLSLVLTLWIVCGLVNLCGALTMSELAAMMPHAGGTYLFLREGYGKLCAFLWTWTELTVARSGAIAALAVAMTLSLRPLLNSFNADVSDDQWRLIETAVACGVILLLAAINVLGARFGGAVQNATTVVKVASVVFLAILPWAVASETPIASVVGPFFSDPKHQGWLAAIGGALSGIMWAYDGWGNLTVVAEEIRQPERNVPRALFGGVTLLIALYVAANVGYHLALPYETLADGSRDAPIIAVAAAKASLGVQGERIVLAMVMISVFGALNQNILTGPRIIFAAARDHEKLKLIRRVDPRTQTPAIAIAALSLWSIVLLLGASFVASESGTLIETLNSLTGFVIFGGSIFYLLAVVAVFVLRRSMSDAKRPYRTWGYPFTPLVFIAFYVFLLTSVFVGEQKESLAGLALIAAGGLAYFVVRSPQNSQRGSMG